MVETLLENGHQRIRDSSGIGGHGNPFQYSCLENPHGQRRLMGYSQWGRKSRTLLSDSAKNTAHQVDGIELTFTAPSLPALSFRGSPPTPGREAAGGGGRARGPVAVCVKL